MRKLVVLGILVCSMLTLASCHQSKPTANGKYEKSSEPLRLTDPTQVDILLNQFEGNMYQWTMLTNDICTNGDAMINLEVRNSEIMKAIEENPQMLTEEQQERYNNLREEYKKRIGN